MQKHLNNTSKKMRLESQKGLRKSTLTSSLQNLPFSKTVSKVEIFLDENETPALERNLKKDIHMKSASVLQTVNNNIQQQEIIVRPELTKTKRRPNTAKRPNQFLFGRLNNYSNQSSMLNLAATKDASRNHHTLSTDRELYNKINGYRQGNGKK